MTISPARMRQITLTIFFCLFITVSPVMNYIILFKNFFDILFGDRASRCGDLDPFISRVVKML